MIMMENFKNKTSKNNNLQFIKTIEDKESKLNKQLYDFSIDELIELCKNNLNLKKYVKKYIVWCCDNAYASVDLSDLL